VAIFVPRLGTVGVSFGYGVEQNQRSDWQVAALQRGSYGEITSGAVASYAYKGRGGL